MKPSSARWRRRSGALVVATATHGALLLLLIARPGFAPVIEPKDPGAGTIALSLVGSASVAGSQPAQASEFTKLAQQLTEAPTPSVATHELPRATGDIFRALDAAAAKSAPPSPVLATAGAQLAAGGPSTAGSPGVNPWSQGSIFPANQNGITGGIWSQVARCWRRPASAVTVTLRVDLDAAGAVSGMPTLVSVSNASEPEIQHAAEIEADRAVRACAPYAVGNRDERSFELRFGDDYLKLPAVASRGRSS